MIDGLLQGCGTVVIDVFHHEFEPATFSQAGDRGWRYSITLRFRNFEIGQFVESGRDGIHSQGFAFPFVPVFEHDENGSCVGILGIIHHGETIDCNIGFYPVNLFQYLTCLG